MTEAEWLAATDPRPMLHSLQDNFSERKLRLFAAACCRRWWHLLAPEWSRRAVETAERFADGLATGDELAPLWSEFIAFRAEREDYDNPAYTDEPWHHAVEAAGWTACREISDDERAFPWHTYWDCADCAAWAINVAAESGEGLFAAAEKEAQGRALLCLFGNPFRPMPSIDPAWLVWHGGWVSKLARFAYDDRRLPEGTLDTARLAVLADALEDAGCADPDLLGHLRGPGPHVRGCWAVDLLLGKG